MCPVTPAAFAASRKPVLIAGTASNVDGAVISQTGFLTAEMSKEGPGGTNLAGARLPSRYCWAALTSAPLRLLGAGGRFGSVDRATLADAADAVGAVSDLVLLLPQAARPTDTASATATATSPR